MNSQSPNCHHPNPKYPNKPLVVAEGGQVGHLHFGDSYPEGFGYPAGYFKCQLQNRKCSTAEAELKTACLPQRWVCSPHAQPLEHNSLAGQVRATGKGCGSLLDLTVVLSLMLSKVDVIASLPKFHQFSQRGLVPYLILVQFRLGAQIKVAFFWVYKIPSFQMILDFPVNLTESLSKLFQVEDKS